MNNNIKIQLFFGCAVSLSSVLYAADNKPTDSRTPTTSMVAACALALELPTDARQAYDHVYNPHETDHGEYRVTIAARRKSSLPFDRSNTGYLALLD